MLKFDLHESLIKICQIHPDIEQMLFVRFLERGEPSSMACYVANHKPNEMLYATAKLLNQIQNDSPTMLTNMGWGQPAEEAELRVVVGDLRVHHALGHPLYKDVFVVAQFNKGAAVVKSLKKILRSTFKHMGYSPKAPRQPVDPSSPGQHRTLGGH